MDGKRRLLTLLVCCLACLIGLAGTGCTNAGKSVGEETKVADRSAGVSISSAPRSQTPAESRTVPVQWKPVDDKRTVKPIDKLSALAERIVLETPLAGYADAKVTIYARRGDLDNMYAALDFGGVTYDLGIAGGYAYDKKENYAIGSVYLFRRQTLELTGPVGANASLVHYVALDGDRPEPLLLVDAGTARRVDIDHDGSEEVVASSGIVYRQRDGVVETADLKRSLGAESVSFGEETAIAAVKDGAIRLYWLTGDGLRPFAEYTEEAYAAYSAGIAYRQEELDRIFDSAVRNGIWQVCAAGKSIGGDAGVTVSEEGGAIRISYPHFYVRQSAHDVRPAGKPVRTEQLPAGKAQWLGTESKGAWFMALGDTYVEIGTDEPADGAADPASTADRLLMAAAALRPIEALGWNRPKPEVTRSYLLALHAADQFLAAWLKRDASAGKAWITRELARTLKPDKLDGFFVGLSNPHHQGYELEPFMQAGTDKYLFKVNLYEFYTSQPDAVNGLPQQPPVPEILEVVRENGEQQGEEEAWRVGKLP